MGEHQLNLPTTLFNMIFRRAIQSFPKEIVFVLATEGDRWRFSFLKNLSQDNRRFQIDQRPIDLKRFGDRVWLGHSHVGERLSTLDLSNLIELPQIILHLDQEGKALFLKHYWLEQNVVKEETLIDLRGRGVDDCVGCPGSSS